MGQIKSKALRDSVESKHCTPVGLYPKCNWPQKTIKKLICDKKLQPIFKGVEDPTPGVEMDECPICFLQYPLGLNRSRCCRQEICTECFLQIKGSPTTSSDCPFCNKGDFGVVYLGPKSKAERQTEEQELRKVEEAQKRMREEEIKRDAERKQQQEEKEKQEKLNPPPIDQDSSESESETSKSSSDYGSESESISEEVAQEPNPPAIDFNELLANNENPAELENLMIMEAIRLSLAENEHSKLNRAFVVLLSTLKYKCKNRFLFSCGEMSGNVACRWANLVKCLPSTNTEITSKWWERISTYYSEPQRHYHTLEHIKAMFRYYDEVHDKLKKPNLVSLAIFFHDIIYEPTWKDNEEKSAEVFKEFSKELNLAENETNIVYQWIVDTKEHKGLPGRENNDLNLFIDMDLSIFGASRDDYKTYAVNIRKEYIHVEDEAFRIGRGKVLEHFLPTGDSTIFKSQYFIDLLEERAKDNIQWEIQELQNGLIN